MKRSLLVLLLLPADLVAQSQGTIQFANSILTKVQLLDVETGEKVPVPTSIALNYGVFVNGSPTPVLPLGISSASLAGIIDAPNGNIYPLPGIAALESVYLQIRGWASEFGEDWQAAIAAGALYGETDIRQVVPGEIPGSVIWQSLTGTRTNCFYPLVVVGGGMTVGDITVAEGSNGVANAVFVVKLSGPRENTVTVDFATEDGSAVAGQDYIATHGTVTFAPGEISKTITVTVTADAPPEPDELFSVILSNPVNATLRKGSARCLVTEARISDIRFDTAIVFHTVVGRLYAVERTTDMVIWETIPGAENVLGVGGPMTIYDKGTGCGSGLRLYRTRLLTR